MKMLTYILLTSDQTIADAAEKIAVVFNLTPTDVISILAFLLSAGIAIKDLIQWLQDRRRSIDDLFWFREVAYPLAIKPVIETLNKIRNEIPKPATTTTTTPNIQKEAANLTHELVKVRGIYVPYISSLLTETEKEHQSLSSTIDDCLMVLEDDITTYCYENSKKVTSQYCHPKEWMESRIDFAMQTIVKKLKEIQSK